MKQESAKKSWKKQFFCSTTSSFSRSQQQAAGWLAWCAVHAFGYQLAVVISPPCSQLIISGVFMLPATYSHSHITLSCVGIILGHYQRHLEGNYKSHSTWSWVNLIHGHSNNSLYSLICMENSWSRLLFDRTKSEPLTK